MRWLAAVCVVLSLAACSSPDFRTPTVAGTAPSAVTSPAFRDSGFAACPAPTGDAPAGSPLAGIVLPCMDSRAASVAVGKPIGRPRVVTLWGSWCPPCGKELPAFAAFSRQAGDRIQVMGVNTADGARNAVAAAKDLGVAFPNVYDRRARVQRALGVVALPATAFLDRDGRLVHLHTAAPLDQATLTRLVGTHLGVAV